MSKKNGLELLQQEVEIPAVVQRRAQDAFGQIHRETKLADQRIVRMDREAGRKEQTMKKRGRRTERALVVAVVAAVMALGTMTVAVAAFRGELAESLRSMFKVSGKMEEDLLSRDDGLLQIIETPDNKETTACYETEEAEPAETVEETIEETTEEVDIFSQEGDITSVTCNGITVSLVQAMVDRYHVNLVLRIEGLGDANNESVGFEEWGFFFGDKRAGSLGGGIGYVGDDYVEYTWSIRPKDRNNEGPGWFLGKQLEMNFKDIDMLIGKEEGTTMVQEGEWNLRWTIQGTVETNTFVLNHELEPEIVITEVDLTPISAVVYYEFPKQVVQEQTANGGVANLIKDPPYIQGAILKDGTVLEYIAGGMGNDRYATGSTSKYISTRALGVMLDPSEVESLIFLDWGTQKQYVVPLYE